jgi:hypothetical protein
VGIIQTPKEIQLMPELFVSKIWINVGVGAVFHDLAVDRVANSAMEESIYMYEVFNV